MPVSAGRCRGLVGGLAIALLLVRAALAGDAHPGGADLALEWQISAAGSAEAPRTRATLRLENHGTADLPASGWALYFTSLTPIQVPLEQDGVIAEQVVGTLFRLRADGRGRPLPPGAVKEIELVHKESVVRPDKAPQGPYLAYDDDPRHATAIGRYTIVPGLPPASVGGERAGGIDAEELFRRYQPTVRLSPDELPSALPTPASERRGQGTWHVARQPVVLAPSTLAFEADRVKAMFAARVSPGSMAGAPVVRLEVGRVAGRGEPESYRLFVDADRGVVLRGTTPAGVARGVETLRQLLPPADGRRQPFGVPAIEIVDAPRFAYRGLMVDVARNFQSKETLFRLLELMAQFKMNRLHLHLADDEGWRLAIRGLPELTDYGARRGHARDEEQHLLPAHGSGPRLDDPHGSGYYRAEDFIAILKYAAQRHIEVIPELEMPGHARAAVKAMAYRARQRHAEGRADADEFLLADPADTSHYHSPQLHDDNVIDPGLESSYRFIDHVLREVARLYRRAGVPLTMIHVGGDELAQGAWERSPACRRLMAREHLATIADVWDYFYSRVAKMVARTGTTMAGWEELGVRDGRGAEPAPAKPNPLFAGRGFPLFVWNNLDDAADLANRLANAGYSIVLAPATRFYFDMAYQADLWEPGADWAGSSDLEAIFDFVPFDMTRRSPAQASSGDRVALQESARARVMGLEGTLFSETMREPRRIDFLLMPRLLALAERAWAADPAWTTAVDPQQAQALHDQAWSRFANLLGQRLLPRLDIEWPELGYRLPPPGLERVGDRVETRVQLPGLVVRYTTDGSNPDAFSSVASGPITSAGPVTAATFSSTGRMSRLVRSIDQGREVK